MFFYVYPYTVIAMWQECYIFKRKSIQINNMDKEYLLTFEQNLQKELLRLCTSYKMLDGVLLESDDLEERWHTIAPEYVADAVKEIKDYPLVSVAWSSYLGLAAAFEWDKDWEKYKDAPYQSYYGPNGFDDMDEHITQKILGLSLDNQVAKDFEDMIRRCAQTTVTFIRREEVQPQSEMAFYIYARAIKVMFRIGAAMELKRLGYKFQKMGSSNPFN